MTGSRIARVLAVVSLSLGTGCARQPEAPQDLNGRWDVQQIAGASLGEGVRINVTIDSERGEVSGFTGCNDFTASIQSFSEAIAIGAVHEADVACPNVAAATDEARFLGVLSSIGRYARHGRALELLPRESGEALVRLRYADTQASSNE